MVFPQEYQNCRNNNIIPFHAWDCITLQLLGNDIDLVIKKPKNMMKLVRFLIYSMNTLDGKKDSAALLCKSIFEQKLKMQQSSSLIKYSNEELMREIKHQIVNKVEKRYRIFWIRQKISFMAFINEKTIAENIQFAILNQYYKREENGLIWNVSPENRLAHANREFYLKKVFSGDKFFSFEAIMMINADKMNTEEKNIINK